LKFPPADNIAHWTRHVLEPAFSKKIDHRIVGGRVDYYQLGGDDIGDTLAETEPGSVQKIRHCKRR
jgi:hypothetical protein